MTNTNSSTQTTAAKTPLPTLWPKETAAAIRPILRQAFPGVKFSVTVSRGASCLAVDIGWTGGPKGETVRPIVAPFLAGHFDGMTDCYEYGQGRTVNVGGETYRPGAKYLSLHRA